MNKSVVVKKKQRRMTAVIILLSLFIISIIFFIYNKTFISTLTRAKNEGFEVYFTLTFVDVKNEDVYGAFVGVISSENNRIGLISIPRNMCLYLSDEKSPIPLSYIYSKHGVNAISKAIENTFQIGATYKFVLDNDSILKTIDMIGGVNMYVEEPIQFEDKNNGYNISFDTGQYLFTGEKVLAYINYIQEGLYKDRVSLYKLEDVILNAAIGFIDSSVLKNISITKDFQRIANKIIDSNLDSKDYQMLGELLYNFDVNSLVIETMDGFIDENNMLRPIDERAYAVRQIRELGRRVGLKVDKAIIENQDVVINVLNATDVVGLADKINIRMRYRGFFAIEYGNFITNVSNSVILIRNGEIEKAFLIAKASNVDKIYAVTDRRVLNNSTLVLGNDYYEIPQ